MITSAPTKWIYKAVALSFANTNADDTARLKELTDVLNKASLEYFEPFEVSKHIPAGYVLLRRSLDAPAVTSAVTPPIVKRSIFAPKPKVAAPAIKLLTK